MPKAGYNALVLIDQYDLSSYFNNVDIQKNSDEVDSTTFGNTFKKRTGTLKDGTIQVSGFAEGTLDAVDDFLQKALGDGGNIVTVGHDRSAGDLVDMMSALANAVGGAADPTGLVSTLATFANDKGDSGCDLGVILLPLAAITVTGNGANHDNGAQSLNGGVAHLHVTATSGTGQTLDAIVEHSATGSSSWTTIAAFTQVTTITAKERIKIAGTIKRYTRVSYTIAGTTPSFAAAVAIARH